MFRQRPLLFAIASLIFATLACNAFSGNVEPALELPPPSISDLTSTPNGNGGEPIDLAPTATLPGPQPTIDTPDGAPTVRILVDLNVRSGPGVQYNRVGFLLANDTAPVLGSDPNTGWWKITCPATVTTVTECWISGGAQYSQGVNTDSVPVAVAPPTPTPEPTISPTPESEELSQFSVVAENGRLAYADSSGVWMITLDTAQNPPAASPPVQIATTSNVNHVLISPDGRRVAYLAGDYDTNQLFVVDVNGENGRLLTQSTTLNELRGVDTTEAVLLINQVQWLPNSQSIAFNTDLVNQEGPGVGSQEDLWTVSLNGDVTERFGVGELGGAFDISPGNQIVAGGAETIIRANLDGSGREDLIPFELVNTASEYIYYPQPQWSADGSRAFVAVPNREQFSTGANFTLWEIGTTGAAEALTAVNGNILFGSVRWTLGGNRVAYVAAEVGTGALPSLSLATGSGGSPVPYATDAQLSFFNWSPNGSAFLYAGSDFYGIGQIDVAPVQIVAPVDVADMQWINNTHFIAAIGQVGSWTLESSNLTGEHKPITNINTTSPSFDIWSP